MDKSIISRVASRLQDRSSPELGKVVLALENDLDIQVAESPEGNLSVTDGEAIAHLQKWLLAKYAIDVAYRNFADRVRGPWRDALVDHWYEHSKEERQHAYDLTMKIIGMGADPSVTMIQVPPVTPGPEAMMATLMKMELEAISAGREAVRMAGGRQSLRVMAENFILVDTQHLDDLRRWSAARG